MSSKKAKENIFSKSVWYANVAVLVYKSSLENDAQLIRIIDILSAGFWTIYYVTVV